MKNLANQPPSNAGQRHSDRLARPSRLGPALQAFAALEAADWKARGILPNYCPDGSISLLLLGCGIIDQKGRK
jgi:hypothetical protein